MKDIIKINGVSKSYGKVKALDNLTLNVKKGELFGLIGPDGAGKTSLIRILTTLLKADSGLASVNGWDVIKNYHDIRKNVGYMPGTFSLYKDLTIEENLNFFAAVFGTSIEANYELIKPIYEQIEPFKHRRAGKLSGGMKQKLALSCALIHRPDVLFLDEPTTGVDAVSRQEFWSMLKSMKSHGISVFVSTPYMDEAILCDRVALIQNGRLLDVDTPDNVISKFEKELLKVKAEDKYELLQDLRAFKGTEAAYPFGEYMHVVLNESYSIKGLEGYLKDKKHVNLELSLTNAGIEDRFIQLMDTESSDN